jgi:ADP-ribosylglycohydrolase
MIAENGWHPTGPSYGISRPRRFLPRSKTWSPEIVGSYVVKSLEAALWAFHDAKDFREALLWAVNLGDDADTTGAVCGQLAGAYWGEEGIPVEWWEGLARKDMVENALQGLLLGRA